MMAEKVIRETSDERRATIEPGPELSETPVIDGMQAGAPGRVFGCVMPAGDQDPIAGDFKSLKEAAQNMLGSGSWLGLNPHKVIRLCTEFEQLKKTGRLSEGTRRRVIISLSWLVADAKHRFDDCRNNFEAGPDPELAAGGYSPELAEAIELLAALEAGTEQPDQDHVQAAFQEGFVHAKRIILAEIQKLVN